MATQLLNTPSTHKWSLVAGLDSGKQLGHTPADLPPGPPVVIGSSEPPSTVWNSVRDAAIDVGWSPAARLAEAAVVSQLRRMNHGQLCIRIPASNREYNFPQTPTSSSSQVGADHGAPALAGGSQRRDPTVGTPFAELTVLNNSFWIRLALMSDLGFAEAFMYGDVECSDLISLFKIFLLNRSALSDMSTSLSWLASLPQQTLTSYRFLNTLSNSRSNISAHYDISNDMFMGFLSKDMTYSCAIFDSLDADLGSTTSSTRLDSESRERIAPIVDLAELDRSDRWSRVAVAASPTRRPNGTKHRVSRNAKGHKDTRSSSPNRMTTTTTSSTTTREVVVNPDMADSDEDSSSDSSATAAATPSLAKGEVEDELYVAQMRKIHHVIRQARIESHHRVLEIGSGWGALAIEAVRLTGCHVDTLTLSVAQKELAEERIRNAGTMYEERIKVHLMDYRAMPEEWKADGGVFDRFVSVEMIEAVGREFLDGYWRCVDQVLKRTDAVGVVQVITIPEALFPGGFLPTVTFLLETLNSGSSGSLVVDSISNIGPHYARTLREWRHRFEAKFDEVVVPALQREYPEVMGPKAGESGLREIEVFKKKWIYYYCYCEIGFTTRTLGDHILTFTREGNEAFGCDVYQ